MFDAHKEKLKPYVYTVFRVIVGGLFFIYGGSKLLWGDGIPQDPMMLTAGILELVIGVAIVLGVLTSIASFVGAIEMLVAYFMVHLPNGLNPVSNGGSAALLFFAAFLILKFWGSGQYGLERMVLKKELL